MATKRILDIFLSGILLLILCPLMALVSVAIAVLMGRPMIFRQDRIGLDGRAFPILKFRTMMQAETTDGSVLPDSIRLTPLGRFLRATSLDELPQLLNVFLGQMSLVGPRPLMNQYVECCTAEQARRAEVRPGITGLAQISGRKALSYAERFALDVWYIDHWSLSLDFRILVATASVVLRRDGATDKSEMAVIGVLGLEREG